MLQRPPIGVDGNHRSGPRSSPRGASDPTRDPALRTRRVHEGRRGLSPRHDLSHPRAAARSFGSTLPPETIATVVSPARAAPCSRYAAVATAPDGLATTLQRRALWPIDTWIASSLTVTTSST